MNSPTIVVLIKENPYLTHRATEGIRIALGLSTGPNPLTIILVGQAQILLTEEASETIGGEILEQHIFAIQELQIPILVPHETEKYFSLDPSFHICKVSFSELSRIFTHADRVLVF